jgi:hypothetical protein
MSFASIVLPVTETDLRLQSLHGATGHFISPEAYRAHKATQSLESPVIAPAHAPSYGQGMRRTIIKGASARMNVLDYLAWVQEKLGSVPA